MYASVSPVKQLWLLKAYKGMACSKWTGWCGLPKTDLFAPQRDRKHWATWTSKVRLV